MTTQSQKPVIQIGIDFGGTKIEAAALDASGHVLMRRRMANPGNYDAALDTICRLVAEIRAAHPSAQSVGIGLPGSISAKTGVMHNANSTYLNGRPFREDIAKALQQEIRLANDANCFALSEALDGAGAGAAVVAGIILGTGCGGGVVVGRQLIEGSNGIAGEWGHIPLPWATADELPGPLCWCGRHGCLESYISGTGLKRDFLAQSGEDISSEEIVARYRQGYAKATVVFEHYLDRLARGLALISSVLDPDVYVLGGGLSNISETYTLLPNLMRRYVFSDSWNARIVPAKWGDSSGVRGAARLWPVDRLT